MGYFKFDIPKDKDGNPIAYSPGWHGTLDKCPSNVEVLCYNDKEGYGIAIIPDTELHKDLMPMDAAEAERHLAELKVEDGVFVGEEAIANRMDWLPEAEIEEKVAGDTVEEIINTPSVTQTAQFCPICHQFIMYVPSNIQAKRLVMTCPAGHKVVVYGVNNG